MIASSRESLKNMLTMTEEFAKKNNITFSTDPNPQKSKTKCVIFHASKLKSLPMNLTLNNNILPWVKEFKYLGIMMSDQIDGMKRDILAKRAQYIEKQAELSQLFQYCHPEIKNKVNRIYNCSMYGSPLWDLSSQYIVTLENTYNRSIRTMWDLPLSTHRRLIEPLSGFHLYSDIKYKTITFYQRLKLSPKPAVQLMLGLCLRDKSSITGKNIDIIMNTAKMEDFEGRKRIIFNIAAKKFKNGLKYHPLSDDEHWKVGLIRDMIEIRRESSVTRTHNDCADQTITRTEVEQIIHEVCTS